MWHDGRLLATYKDGRAHLNAYLDDYAFLIDALLELLQTRWQREDLDLVLELAEILLVRFADQEKGGFFFTSSDHERLIHRPKPLEDESVPSGNGVAARVLQRIGHLIGEPRYLQAARNTLALAADSIRRLPYAHASLLAALEEHLSPPETVIIRGQGDDLTRLTKAAHRIYAPRRLLLAIPAGEPDLPGTLAAMPAGAETRLYRCVGTRCEPPLEDPWEMKQMLGAAAVPGARS
jgi:hypothetical protein